MDVSKSKMDKVETMILVEEKKKKNVIINTRRALTIRSRPEVWFHSHWGSWRYRRKSRRLKRDIIVIAAFEPCLYR